jgi:hypothetical protein
MSTELAITRQGGIEERAAAIDAAMEKLLGEVPDGGELGEVRILEQVLLATSMDEIDRPWAINGLGQFVDQMVQIDDITRMPSDFKDGYRWYLVAEGVVCETGEALSFSTSSRAIITQLVVVRRLGLLPAQFWVRVAEEPTEAGYYPQHLEPVREYHTARRAPGARSRSGVITRPVGEVDPRVAAFNAHRLAQREERERAAARNTETIVTHVDGPLGGSAGAGVADDEEPGF